MPNYYLRMLEPSGVLHGVPESFVGADGVWGFLVGLQSSSFEQAGRVQVLQIVGGAVVDTVGVSPPTFQLRGTFGAKPKTIRGVTLDSSALMLDFQAFVRHYFEERKRRLASRVETIEMAYDDFVTGQHWIVVPDGVPKMQQNVRNPTRPDWNLNLQALRRADTNPTPEDTLSENLAPGGGAGVANQLTPYENLGGLQ